MIPPTIWVKLFSGRFVFTVISGIVFLNASLSGLIPADKTAEIIMLVIVFYFNRTDRGGNGENN